jgi:hypothetical protein
MIAAMTSESNVNNLVEAVLEIGHSESPYLRHYHQLVNNMEFKETHSEYRGYYEIGHIGGMEKYPVTIELEYYTVNGKYVVLWHSSNYYCDIELCREWLKKRFSNCKLFGNSHSVRHLK